MGQSPQESMAHNILPLFYEQMMGAKTAGEKLQAQFGPGGPQSADAMWAKIQPYYSKAISSAEEYGGAQLGALRGTAGAALVESGVAPGAPLNSAFLSSIAPLIAEIAKFRGGIHAAEGASYQDLLNYNAGLQLNAYGGTSQAWGGGLDRMGQLLNFFNKSTPGGDFLSLLQTGTNIASGIKGLTA